MKPALSTRQAEVAALVARGHPDKMIAHETGLSIKTVQAHIQKASAKLPGDAKPRYKMVLWFFNLAGE